ncbi:MAG: hypothetical protein GY838_15305 [bacterium]|nr:hypothetical protein [bacterium]
MLIKLAISWICVGVFAATAVITLLALIRVVKLAKKKYLDRLFGVLIVEIVVIAVGVFAGFVDSPKTIETQIKEIGRQELAREWQPRLEASRVTIERLSDSATTLTPIERQRLANSFGKFSAAVDSVATGRKR